MKIMKENERKKYFLFFCFFAGETLIRCYAGRISKAVSVTQQKNKNRIETTTRNRKIIIKHTRSIPSK